MQFDAAQTWTSFEKFRDRPTTPRQRQIFDTVVTHSRAEVAADLDTVMSTLVENPRFHDYGVFAGEPGDTGPKGLDEVTGNYQAMVDNGSYVIESQKERVIVDDDRMVTEGSFRQILTAEAARGLGHVGADATGFFLVTARTVVFWEFDDGGRAHGEDRYVFVQSVDPLPKEELPDGYPERLLADG